MPTSSALLIVEDNAADSAYILTLLTESRHSEFVPIVAQTITEALHIMSQRDIDIITLDLFLPDSTGLGTLLALRARASDVPIVVVTGLDDQKVAQEALYYGAHAYLIKGEFDAGRLLNAMTKAVAVQSQLSLVAAIKRMKKSLDDSSSMINNQQLPDGS